MESDIQNFYRNKTIFLTGGTGFLGKVFIEKTLRATDVKRIYLLMRPKRGKDVEERIKDIFKDPLFEKLNQSKPNSAQRIEPIFGDCALLNLGLSSEDRATLIENAEIVVHGAATVRFNEPLSNAININVRGTREMLLLAKQMVNLKAFVYVSTAFANCALQRPHIEEQFYTDKLVMSSENACKIAEILGTDLINNISNELCRGFPNTYCLTKVLGEEAVMTLGKDLPICVFRPGIVNVTCKEPIAGWIDNFYGPTGIICGILSGVIRVMRSKVEVSINAVPVDFSVNLILACAWNTADSHKVSPLIYNFVPDQSNTTNWKYLTTTGSKYFHKMPFSQMLWYPFVFAFESYWIYKIFRFVFHTIPGYALDLVFFLRGDNRRLTKLYNKIEKLSDLLEFFVVRNWTFDMDNTKLLWTSLSMVDQRLFEFDMLSFDWNEYFYNCVSGMRQFLLKDDPSTIPAAKKLLKRLYILHRSVQFFALVLLLWSLRAIFSRFY